MRSHVAGPEQAFITILQLFEKSIQMRNPGEAPSLPVLLILYTSTLWAWTKLAGGGGVEKKTKDTQRSKDKWWRKQDLCFSCQVREHCSCPRIPWELCRTRIWSAEIKARKNKESQSDKQLTGKKSQTNTDSLWSDWDKNQLFSLISHFLHHREDRTCDVPDKGLGTLGMNTYSKCHFSAHLFSYSNQVFLASPPRDYCVMRSYVYTHCELLNLSVGQEFYTAWILLIAPWSEGFSIHSR